VDVKDPKDKAKDEPKAENHAVVGGAGADLPAATAPANADAPTSASSTRGPRRSILRLSLGLMALLAGPALVCAA
jgi:hypothetical protein